jgi:hypothetical protein
VVLRSGAGGGGAERKRKPPLSGRGGRIPLANPSEFVWKDVAQAHFQFVQEPLQFVQRQVVFAAFNAVEGGVRKAGFLGELGV